MGSVWSGAGRNDTRDAVPYRHQTDFVWLFICNVNQDTGEQFIITSLQWGHWSPQVVGGWWCGLPFVRHHSHNYRSWIIPSAACLPKIYQHQSVACLVGSRLVGIDPHPVCCLMVWSWICVVVDAHDSVHLACVKWFTVSGQKQCLRRVVWVALSLYQEA